MAVSEERHASLHERLRALADYLPRLESPGFEFGHWHETEEKEPGVTTLGYFEDGSVSSALVKAAYETGWVLPTFDWGEWQGSLEAGQLRDDSAALERATPDQLARLLTVLIRQDRFVEGALNDAFESGLLTGILRRAAVLADDVTDEQRLRLQQLWIRRFHRHR